MFDKNMTLEKFFYDNKKGFDTLVWLHKIFNKFFKEQNEAVATYNSLISSYMDFKKGFQEEQSKKIEGYRSRICDETGTNEWWLYCHGRVLGIHIKEDAPRIGIECVFEDECYDNPLGTFRIYVATWDEPEFGIYEQAIRKAFPAKEKPKHKKRLFIPVEIPEPGDENAIISTLEDTYKTLNRILDEPHK